MGDLAADTAVAQVDDGRYTARLSRDWEIWGPNGGYVASVALRAAGAAAAQPRPASMAVQYLGVAEFDEVDVVVQTVRATRRAECLRVSITQGGAPIVDATVWAVADGLEALDHDFAPMPPAPSPDDIPTMQQRLDDAGLPPTPFRFWANMDQRSPSWHAEWPPPGPIDPEGDWWVRFQPTATFGDPWIDACRSTILLDTFGWPAAANPHAWRIGGGGASTFIAPTIDLHVTFSRFEPTEPWLYVVARSSAGADGLLHADTWVWSRGGALLGRGAQTMLARRVAPDPA